MIDTTTINNNNNNNLGLRKVNDKWIPLQIKVFSRWVQCQLKDCKETQINDITQDLSDGLALIQLAKVLTQKDAPRQWIPTPVRNVDMVQNCELALEMFKNDGIYLLGISGKDIYEKNQKLILGLIWTLIVHYSISQSVNFQNDGKKALLSWAIERTSKYPNVKNFAPYELSLCALLDSFVPEKVNYFSLNPEDTEHNSQLATNVMKELGIPVLVYPDEITKNNNNSENQVDEKTLLTQLSSAKFVLDRQSQSSSMLALNGQNQASSSKFVQNNQNQVSSSSDEDDEDDADSKLEEQLQSVIEEKKKAEAEIQRLNKSLASIEAESKVKYSEDSENLSKAKSEIECETKARQEAEVEISNLKQELISAKSNITSLTLSYEEDKQKSKSEIDHFKEEINKLQNELEQSKNKITELQNELAEARKNNQPQINVISKEVLNSENIQKELNIRIESLSNEIEKLKIEISESKTHEKDLINQLSEEQNKAKSEIEHLTSENEKLKSQLDESQKVINNHNNSLSEVEKLKIELEKAKAALESETKSRSLLLSSVYGDNYQYEEKKFSLTMSLKKSDYNDGKQMSESNENVKNDDQSITLGLTLVNPNNSFINSAGLKLDITEPNAENDKYQQFVFGKGSFNTVIDSVARKGMVWDVANQDDLDPPEGTPFYLFPFHGRHNQRFIYKNEMIYAKQNGQVVTYVGGDVPFVMMEPKEALKSRQTFHIQLL